MIQKLLQNIINKNDIRKSLIELNAAIKDADKTGKDIIGTLKKELDNEYIIFTDLLLHEDVKVRKNTALILGQIGEEKFLPYIFNAYKNEVQLYVKGSYLKAISYLDYRSIMPELKQCKDELLKAEYTSENKKHLSEELHIITDMIHAIEGFKKHEFCGYSELSEAALLTNRNHIHVTYDELSCLSKTVCKVFNAGIMIKTKELDKVMQIRTFRELLFCVEGMKVLPNDPVQAADAIVHSNLKEFLKKRHTNDMPFYFRIEIKNKQDSDNRSKFTKKLSTEIENLTERWLINSTGNYEFEIRLIENKDGNYNTMIKLFTIPDERFNYRKNTIPSSINPVNAALTMLLSKDYLTEEAQVLDPFCGTGTMLIERNKLLPAGTMYGTDIYSDAINCARENTEAAGYKVNYINRDFFDFKHSYLFDEIITDMPFITGRRVNEELAKLYMDFFIKAAGHLKDKGVMVIYTHNYDLITKYIKQSYFKVEKEYEISMKEGTYVFILRYHMS